MVTSQHNSLIGFADLKLAAPEMARSGHPFSLSADLFFRTGSLKTLSYSFSYEASEALLSVHFEGLETISGSRLNAHIVSTGRIQGAKSHDSKHSSAAQVSTGIKASVAGISPTIGSEAVESSSDVEGTIQTVSAEKRIECLIPLPNDVWQIKDAFADVNGASLHGPYLNGTALCKVKPSPRANRMHTFAEVSIKWSQFTLVAEGSWLKKEYRERFQKEKMLKAILAKGISLRLHGDEVNTSLATGAVVVARSEVSEDHE